MRTLRMSLVGTVMVALLGGLGGAVVAQDEAEEPTGVRVTVTQECVDFAPCRWTASDPRLPGTLTHEFFTGEVEAEGAGFVWMDVMSEGPEGGWTGHVYALFGEPTFGEPTQSFLVLSGNGANEGWHYIASSIDPDTDGDFEWIGTLYEGELPPYESLEPSAE